MLKGVPAEIHFISYEPALGPLTLSLPQKPDWIICGGENAGPLARKMKRRWAHNLLDECQALRVPFFMKQMTNKKPIPERLFVRELPRQGPRRINAM
jgi:protein gp37